MLSSDVRDHRYGYIINRLKAKLIWYFTGVCIISFRKMQHDSSDHVLAQCEKAQLDVKHIQFSKNLEFSSLLQLVQVRRIVPEHFHNIENSILNICRYPCYVIQYQANYH